MIALFRIALRNVLRNRRRSLITFSAIFLSITVTLCLRGLVNGMVDAMRSSVVLGQTGALQVHRKGYLQAAGNNLDLDLPADDAFLDKIRSVPGVRAVSPRLTFGGMVNANDATSPSFITAIDPEGESKVCPQREQMATTGRGFTRTESGTGIITPELARTLGLQLGQTAALMTSDKEGALNAVDISVVGLYGQPGLPLPEKKVGFIPLGMAQELLRMPGRATEIIVAVDDLNAVDQVKQGVQQALGAEGEYEVSTWSELMPFIKDGIASWRFLSRLLTAIFMVVALLGIVNTMLMSVLERTREIGTMMALGVRRKNIMALFLSEAGLLGCLGGLLGGAAGWALVGLIGRKGLHFHMSTSSMHVHPFVDPAFLVTVFILATAGAVLAALWPALRASRLRPVTALASV